MSPATKFNQRTPKLKQWFWFIVLWMSGLGTMLVIAYPFKWIIRTLM